MRMGKYVKFIIFCCIYKGCLGVLKLTGIVCFSCLATINWKMKCGIWSLRA